MKEFKEIIIILKEYKILEVKIKNLQLKFQELEEYEKTGIRAIDYSKDRIGKTYKFNSEIENQAIWLVEEKAKIQAEITRLTTLKNRIENAMQILDDEEKTIIKEKFLNNKKWYQISMDIGSSMRRTIYIAEGALEKLEKILFESEVIK